MYRHGIYVSEQETSMIAPLNGTAGLQVVIGTAPVHLLADPLQPSISLCWYTARRKPSLLLGTATTLRVSPSAKRSPLRSRW